MRSASMCFSLLSVGTEQQCGEGNETAHLEKETKRTAISSWYRHTSSAGLNYIHPFEHYTFKSL